jgi:CheY-like chemotaxis protein
MATIRIPRTYAHSRVLLADDEPEHLDWLVDYLRGKGCDTVVVTNVRDAIDAVEMGLFRAYLIDLNIPLGGWKPTVMVKGTTYEDYHGLYILKLVRSQGNSGARVMAYSAHHNEQISLEIKRLYCRYVVKGRPKQLKDEIEQLLRRDPRKERNLARKRPVEVLKVTRKQGRRRFNYRGRKRGT